VLSHKTNQNQGILYVTIAYCYVTKTYVARNKYPHVKVARNTTKVAQACCGGTTLTIQGLISFEETQVML